MTMGTEIQGGPGGYPAKFLNDFFSHLKKPDPCHRTGPLQGSMPLSSAMCMTNGSLQSAIVS